MEKESLAASILRPILTVLAAFCLIVATPVLLINYTILDPHIWVQSIDTADMAKELRLVFIEDLEANSDLEQVDEFAEAICTDELLKFALDETLEATFYGDPEIDEDKLEDIIMDSADDFFDEYDIPKNEQKEFVSEMVDSLSEGVEEVAEEALSEFDNPFIKIKRALPIIGAGLIGVALVFFVILYVIHKNRGLVVRGYGVATIITQAICLAGAGGLGALILAVANEGPRMNPSDDIEKYIINVFTSIIQKITIINALSYVLFIGIGIVLVIIGRSMINSYRELNEDEEY